MCHRNQSVLLKGVNDDPEVMKELMQKLLAMRVRPYYIYQCDLSQGISHFRTSIESGIKIIEHLRGHTSGLANPTYVVDAPGGGGYHYFRNILLKRMVMNIHCEIIKIVLLCTWNLHT